MRAVRPWRATRHHGVRPRQEGKIAPPCRQARGSAAWAPRGSPLLWGDRREPAGWVGSRGWICPPGRRPLRYRVPARVGKAAAWAPRGSPLLWGDRREPAGWFGVRVGMGPPGRRPLRCLGCTCHALPAGAGWGYARESWPRLVCLAVCSDASIRASSDSAVRPSAGCSPTTAVLVISNPWVPRVCRVNASIT